MAKKIRNVLLKCFMLTFLLLVFSALFYHFNSDWMLKYCESFYGMSNETMQLIMFQSLAMMKIIAIVFFLIPALAIHCEFLHKCCCKKSCDEEQKTE